jgi:FkbM family methyltransferase
MAPVLIRSPFVYYFLGIGIQWHDFMRSRKHYHFLILGVGSLTVYLATFRKFQLHIASSHGVARKNLVSPSNDRGDDLSRGDVQVRVSTRQRQLRLRDTEDEQQMNSSSFGTSSSNSSSAYPGYRIINCVQDFFHPSRQNKNDTSSILMDNPHHGRLYSRWLHEAFPPSFYLSLHPPDIDRVRWSIMKNGRYYEHDQDQLFIDILTDVAAAKQPNRLSTQQQPPSSASAASLVLRVIDIGANIGYYSLRTAAVAASLQVPYEIFAFEPNEMNVARFCESIWLNADTFFGFDHYHNNHPNKIQSNIVIYQQGISDHTGTMPFAQPQIRNPGAGTFKQTLTVTDPGGYVRMVNSTAPIQNLAVTTLDAYAQYMRWLPTISVATSSASTKSHVDNETSMKLEIHILKIDVEGLEPAVIFGANQLLLSKQIWNIIMEITCATSADRSLLEDSLNLLCSAGYMLQGYGGASGPVPHLHRLNNCTSMVARIINHCEKDGLRQMNLWWQHSSHLFTKQSSIAL